MDLESGEKIDSWDVVVRTTNGREFSFSELGLEIYYTVSRPIDTTTEQADRPERMG